MNKSSHSTYWKLVRLLFTAILLAASVSSCGQPASETPVTEKPPTETLTEEPTEEPTAEPTEESTTEPTQEPDRQQCDGGGGNFTCTGDREITLEGVPDGVTPYLLSIPAAFEEFLLGPDAEKQDTSCIFMLAGDLAFYDENDELVTSFDDPVTIKYAFLPQDNEPFIKCQEEAATAASIPTEEVEYLPVYYDKQVWKPFNNVVIDPDGLMTIQFTSWGDQPIGGGTRP